MSAVQWITLAAAVLTVVITLVVMVRALPSERLKAAILLLFVLHVIFFYLVLALIHVWDQQWIMRLVTDIIDPVRPFERWSEALRLHGVFAVMTKEIITWFSRKAR